MLKEIELLKKISSHSNCPHAFLFVGPVGVGKFEVAISFAKFLNCKNNKFEIDNVCDCDQCVSFDKKIHPDIYIIKKQEDKKEIVDSQIIDKNKKEGVIYKINNSPIFGRYNIVIIRNAELMNKTVSNTILKSLEEPKDHTIFILTTNSKESLLKTIVSRCLVMPFSLLNKKELDFFIPLDFDKQRKDLIFDLSSFRYRNLINLKNNETFDKYIEDLKDFGKILKSKDFQKISYINRILDNKDSLGYYIYIWELFFNFYLNKKNLDIIGDVRILNMEESIKKLYNIKDAVKGNYILKMGLINFLLGIN